MSIKGKVNELQMIQNELKSLRARGSKLRQRTKVLEQEIDDYLESKDQPGLKYNGVAIVREDKQMRKSKKKTDQRNDALDVLEGAGVHSPEKVLDAIMEARRGSPTVNRKLKLKKIKPPKH